MRSIVVLLAVALALVASLAAPIHAAEDAPRVVVDPGVARRITPADLQKRMAAGEKAIVLDTRASVGDTIAKGAVHVPNDQIETWAKDVPKGTLIAAYCT